MERDRQLIDIQRKIQNCPVYILLSIFSHVIGNGLGLSDSGRGIFWESLIKNRYFKIIILSKKYKFNQINADNLTNFTKHVTKIITFIYIYIFNLLGNLPELR